MKDPYGERSFEKGKRAAYECGAALQANPGESRKEYLDSAAIYFRPDVETFEELTKEEKTALLIEFNKGIEAEKQYQ